MTTQNDFFPWEDIYEGNVFPSGIFMFEIEEINTENTSSTGKLMPKSRFRCVDPVALKGNTHFDQYVVGTDENPSEVNSGTFGAKALKAIFKASQTPKGTSLSELAMNSIGNRLLIQFGEPTEDDYGLKSRVVTYHKVGEREVGMTKTGATKASGGTAKVSGAGPMLPCPHCGDKIAKAEYAKHVDSCEG